jgi:myo-inositol-1(or 4)-monophosphatase
VTVFTVAERAAWKETALLAVRGAGRLQCERVGTARVERKGAADITTDVDRACERLVAELVRTRHPGHDILGEEEEAAGRRDAPHLWIIDPLDGTKNYAHGYGRSCVSLALAVEGQVILGAVFNPRAEELFFSEKGQGATLNGVPISVSRTETLERAMVASALADSGRGVDGRQLQRLGRLLAVVEAVRSDGCAALDLCDVACGRFDAYFERGLHAWDSAAGALLVEEAGGRVTSSQGAPHDIFGFDTLATNARLHQALLPFVST